MRKPLRQHLSYANVAATLALVVAMGGTSYAAVALPKNSVGAPQLKAKAVRSAEVKNHSLLAKDFKAGQLPKGAKGDTGTVGPAKAYSETASVDLGNNAKASYDVYCPAGMQAIGGGGRGDDTTSELTKVTSSRPAVSTLNTEPPADGATFTGWRITVMNDGANPNIRPAVWVTCVDAPPAP